MTMRLFLFGAGYSARAFAARMRGAAAITGTTRSPEKFAALEAAGIRPLLFDGTELSADVAAALGETTHLLVSAAPARKTHSEFDPLSASLRSAALLRTTGERMGDAACASSPLTKWGRGGSRSEPERGRIDSDGIAPLARGTGVESDGGDPLLVHLQGRLRPLMPELRWIGYLSTVGVYGDHGGAWVTEASECRPVSRRSVARLAAERQWLALASEAGLPLAVLRLAGIYGPGRNALVNLVEGRARRIVKPGQVFNRIHVEDIAAALALLAGNSMGGVFNLADDEPAPPQDVVGFAAALADVEPPPETPFDQAEMTPMARSFYGENKRVSNEAMKAAGLRLAYPDYRAGLTRMWRDGTWR